VLRNQLGTAFGTKKAKKALSDLERNKIDADKLQDYESAIIDNIKVTTESLPTREKREEQLSGDRPIPPFDLDATDPKDSYPLGGIIPQHEWNAIRVGVIINETDDKKRKTMFPQQSSEYVFARVDAAISAQGGDAEDRVKMLYYASLLLSLYSNRRITNKQVLLEKLGNPPEILVNGLITRFAVSKAGQFGKTKDRSFVIDPARENKLLCYLLALALHIDGFAVDINPLGYELSLKPSKVGELFRALGCNVKPMSATEAESRGIPKSQAQSHKVAYLKAPLQLPEVVRRRRAGGR
jgi:DNA-directed RNA polymerase I subunit RPA49